jgi:uncharacterized membrane protein
VERLKASLIIGVVLIALGVVSLVYQGFAYTTREKVLDIGSVEASRETRKWVPLPPILGGLALVGGIAMVISAARKSS